MKNTKVIGSQKFWMLLAAMLAAMLGIFIVITAIALICVNPFQEKVVYVNSSLTTEQAVVDNSDHSYDAVKRRVDNVNENYGQSVKSAYYGDNNTMQNMMKQRMFFSSIKSTLVIVLIILVIILILYKGFGLKLFKKKAKNGDAGDTTTVVEEPTSKPTPKEKPPVQEKKPEPKVEDNDEDTNEAPEKKQDDDVQEVTDSCQLP